MDILLDGKIISESILKTLPDRIEKIQKKLGRKPGLAIINYFENSPSSAYMKIKIKNCEKLGINYKVFKPDISGGQKLFIETLKKIGEDKRFDAIMVEKPLPDGFDNHLFWDNLPYQKDVDCLSTINMGRLFISKTFSEIEKSNFFIPCTPLAVIKILKHYNIDTAGKNICVVGRSSIVGKPLAHILTSMDATVTLCHSKTKNIEKYLRDADIIVIAIGKIKWLKREMIGKKQVIIDVGTNFDENGKMKGDVDFENLKDIALAITPVPGGVGPVTLACLIEAVVKAAEKSIKGESL